MKTLKLKNGQEVDVQDKITVAIYRIVKREVITKSKFSVEGKDNAASMDELPIVFGDPTMIAGEAILEVRKGEKVIKEENWLDSLDLDDYIIVETELQKLVYEAAGKIKG